MTCRCVAPSPDGKRLSQCSRFCPTHQARQDEAVWIIEEFAGRMCECIGSCVGCPPERARRWMEGT